MFATYDLKNALTRAVEISLFTWRRAADDDALDDDQRYGCLLYTSPSPRDS